MPAVLFWNSETSVLDYVFLTVLIQLFNTPQTADLAPPPADAFVNSRDPVTNLVSPDYFEAELAHISSISDRYQIPMSLLACRLFPDQENEAVHDGTLRRYADAISDSLRLSDTLCRWEKQTFMLLLPNTNSQQAEIVRKKILIAIAPLESKRSPRQSTLVHATQHAFGEDAMSTLVTLETLLEGAR
jgi:GGDEF domain-containing protein